LANLNNTDIGKIRKYDCQEWAKRFGKAASPTAFNNTVGTLRMVLYFPLLGEQWAAEKFSTRQQRAKRGINPRLPRSDDKTP